MKCHLPALLIIHGTTSDSITTAGEYNYNEKEFVDMACTIDRFIFYPAIILLLCFLLFSCGVLMMNEYTLRGTISSETGERVAQARVRLYRVPSLSDDQPEGPTVRIDPYYIECRSDLKGEFALYDQWRGAIGWEYLFEVNCEGYLAYRERIVPGVTQDVKVRLIPDERP